MIIGVLSLIAAVGTASTISAYAQLKGSVVLNTLQTTAQSVPIDSLSQSALPNFQDPALTSFANKFNVDPGSVLNNLPTTSGSSDSDLKSSTDSDLTNALGPMSSILGQ